VIKEKGEDMEQELAEIKESKIKISIKKIEKVKEEPKEAKKELAITDLPGVGEVTAEKLIESGFTDLISIAVATPSELVEASGVTDATARKIIQACRDNLEMGFITGTELLEKRKSVFRIKTDSENINKLLNGGFEAGSITECFGEFGSGKTQIGHHLCVSLMAQKDQFEQEPYVIYIDTEATFRPERIKQMAEAKGLDPDYVLSHIKVAKALTSDHQSLLAEKILDLARDPDHPLNVKLVIVDSLTAKFRVEFLGRGTLSERQQKLNKHLHTLMKVADLCNAVVYVSNQVQSSPDVFFGDPTKSVGGHIVGHASTYRIYLRKGKKGSRVAKLIDSASLPEGEAIFMVDEKGIHDI